MGFVRLMPLWVLWACIACAAGCEGLQLDNNFAVRRLLAGLNEQELKTQTTEVMTYLINEIEEGIGYIFDGFEVFLETQQTVAKKLSDSQLEDLQARFDDMYFRALDLQEHAELVYGSEITAPNATKFWLDDLPMDKTKGVLIGLIAIGKGISKVSNATKTMASLPQLIAQAVDNSLAEGVANIALDITNLMKDVKGKLEEAGKPVARTYKSKRAPSSDSIQIVKEEEVAKPKSTAPVKPKPKPPAEIKPAKEPLDKKQTVKKDVGAANAEVYIVYDTGSKRRLQAIALNAAHRNLLQIPKGRCPDVDFIEVLEDDVITMYGETCEWGALFNQVFALVDPLTLTAADLLKKGQELWKVVQAKQCAPKKQIEGTLMAQLKMVNMMNTCTDLGCSKCAAPRARSSREGARIISEDCGQWDNNDHERWVFSQGANAGVDTFQIQNFETEMCVTLPDKPKEGDMLFMSTCNEPISEAQQFKVAELDTSLLAGENYVILHVPTKMCLGFKNQGTEEDDPAFLLERCLCSPSQIFKSGDSKTEPDDAVGANNTSNATAMVDSVLEGSTTNATEVVEAVVGGQTGKDVVDALLPNSKSTLNSSVTETTDTLNTILG